MLAERACFSIVSINAAKTPVPRTFSAMPASHMCSVGWGSEGSALMWAKTNPTMRDVSAPEPSIEGDDSESIGTEPYARMEPSIFKRLDHSSTEEWCVGDEDLVSKIWLDNSRRGSNDAGAVPGPNSCTVKAPRSFIKLTLLWHLRQAQQEINELETVASESSVVECCMTVTRNSMC